MAKDGQGWSTMVQDDPGWSRMFRNTHAKDANQFSVKDSHRRVRMVKCG